MIGGLLLIVTTGLLWALTGAVVSRSARRGVDPVRLLGVAAVIQCGVALVLMPDYAALRSGEATKLWPLVALVGGGGVASAWGFILMQHAMRRGPHTAVWTISQSAMVVPFLGGLWIDPRALEVWRVVGVGLVLLCIVLLGRAHRVDQASPCADDSGPPSPRSTASRSWLVLAVLACLALGFSQLLLSWPSYWQGWQDTAGLRVPLLMAGTLVGCLLASRLRWRGWDRRTLRFAGLLAVNTLVSQFVFFRGMDRLADAEAGAVAFPLAIGVCILGFASYCVAAEGDRIRRAEVLAMAFGLLGVILVSL